MRGRGSTYELQWSSGIESQGMLLANVPTTFMFLDICSQVKREDFQANRGGTGVYTARRGLS